METITFECKSTFNTTIVTTEDYEQEAKDDYGRLMEQVNLMFKNFANRQVMLTAERLSAKMIGS